MKILFCTGGSKRSEEAIRAGIPLAKKLNAETIVFSVGPSFALVDKMLGAEFRRSEVTVDTDRSVRKTILDYAKRGADIVKEAGVTAVAKIALGEVAEEILKEADKGGYGFIVVAAKGKPGDRHLLGSNTRKILAKSTIPVYVV